MPISAKEKRGIREKKKAGMLPPPKCANPRCGADLRDPDVPPEYRAYSELFGLAREVQTGDREAVWQCPVCDHSWQKHPFIPPTILEGPTS